ncbi:hypothetical protein C8R43DRAFT_951819 [Mycena crocata]|nr:hypothetical protein C8R43DRAFT_951819 [Mycena crocata]
MSIQLHGGNKTRRSRIEDRGWIGIQYGSQTRALAATIRKRTAPTIIAVKKDGNRGITEVARLSRCAAGDQEADTATVDISDHGILGAKLSKLTQALAYRGIKELRKKVSRKATNTVIEMVQAALKASFAHVPTAATIWKSIRHKDISRPIRTFLWKSLHERCMMRIASGNFGKTFPNARIELYAATAKRQRIWALAREFWGKKHAIWPQLSLGGILGCSLATFKDEKNRQIPSTARLYRILITESLFLIWKLRCESVIQHDGAPPTEREVQNRWIWTINERLNIDRSLTNSLKFDKQYSLPYSLVLETWKGILKDEAELPENWISKSEVLVGIIPIGPLRPPTPPPAGVG